MSTSPFYHGISVFDLFKHIDEIPKQEWIVEGLLPVGFSILSAREKCGKSILALGSIAAPVALGVEALGSLPTKQGTVLYFSLEEHLSTVMDRLVRFFADKSDSWFPPPDLRLFLNESIETWTDNAIEQLETIISEHCDVRLVVVDTLQMIAPIRKTGNLADGYVHEYKFGSRLQQLGLRYNVSILSIHHTVKGTYQDIFNSIGGSAWGKSAETLAILERDGKDMKLHVRGRSVPNESWRLEQDPHTLLWVRVSSAEGVAHTQRKRTSQLDMLTVATVFDNEATLRHADIKRKIAALGLGESSTDRWIQKRIVDGSLHKAADGTGYRTVADNNDRQIPLIQLPPPSQDAMVSDDGGSSCEVTTTPIIDN